MSPISLSLFKLREIVKQMVLLEDHLEEENTSSCAECIKRRFLLMEALAEEVPQHSRWTPLATELAIQIRRWQIAFSDGVDIRIINGKIKQRRKDLVDVVFRPTI
jgi:hypothetical protein